MKPSRLLVAVLLLLPVVRVGADVAGTGTFGIELGGSPPTVSFDGDIAFDPGARTALGRSVNMAADVGSMTFEGDALVNAAQRSATFGLVAESAGDFEFTAAGAGSCENASCLAGRATFAGRLGTITDPDDILAGGVFTFDGTAAIDALGNGPGGAFAINAFPLALTQAGTDVEVSSTQMFFDTVAESVRLFSARARFTSVGGAGATQFVAFSALPGALPAGITLDGAVSVFVDVATNAMVSGGVRLCLGYPDANTDGVVDGTSLEASRLRLLHATAIGAAFGDVTTAVESQRVCGDASAVGPILIGVAAAGATTTTSLPAGVSTTTTVTVVPGGPTTTTLPLCDTALGCLDAAMAGPLCPGETVNPKLAAVVAKKLAKAQQLLGAARSTTVTKRVAKLVAKARRQIDKVGAKADAFVSKRKGPITPGCRDAIRAAMSRVAQQMDANRI